MRCPRCKGYAEPYMHYEQGLDAGSFCDWYLRCLECGAWFWRARLQVIVTAAELVGEYRGGIREACTVVGCSNTVQSNHHAVNSNGWCHHHHHRWDMHRRHQASSPPPLLLTESGWVDNPAYIRRAPKGSGRTRPQTIRGRCEICGNPDVSIAKRHPVHTCGRCNNLNKGLTAGGKQPKAYLEETGATWKKVYGGKRADTI